MQKIGVVEHRDYFFRIPRVNSDQTTLFSTKNKIEGRGFFIISILSTFFTFFYNNHHPFANISILLQTDCCLKA